MIIAGRYIYACIQRSRRDVEAGYEAVRRIREHVKKTFRPGVLTDIGGFGGLFALNAKAYTEPVLVSGADGVGTKLKLAFIMDKHDTVGIDCVAMCVNDIVCGGAEPLFFLDYLARAKYPEKVELIVKGALMDVFWQAAAYRRRNGRDARLLSWMSMILPDLRLALLKSKIIEGSSIKPGDVL